jgi:hypothetical protein
MNWRTTPMLARVLARNFRRGQINFIRGIMNYKRVYNVEKMLADHARPARYELPTRAEPNAPIARPALYIHAPRGRAVRTIDDSSEPSSIKPALARPVEFRK